MCLVVPRILAVKPRCQKKWRKSLLHQPPGFFRGKSPTYLRRELWEAVRAGVFASLGTSNRPEPGARARGSSAARCHSKMLGSWANYQHTTIALRNRSRVRLSGVLLTAHSAQIFGKVRGARDGRKARLTYQKIYALT